ncbi:MAG: BrnT family toxin [Microcystaceae cyanobacterium]
MNLQFEWDDHKAKLNLTKHGITFEEAKAIFLDPLAYIFDDEWHSIGEQREIVRIQVIQKAVKPILCKHLGKLWQNNHSH